MSSIKELHELQKRLESIQRSRLESELAVEKARIDLEEEDQKLKRIRVHERSMIVLIHDLKGELSGCAHDYQTVPSGRGIGFDEECQKCGWCKNTFPTY